MYHDAHPWIVHTSKGKATQEEDLVSEACDYNGILSSTAKGAVDELQFIRWMRNRDRANT